MRLHEITSTFFIALPEKHKPKTIIAQSGTIYPLGALLEGRLEEKRPEQCLPRESSLFLHVTAPSQGAYIYEVRPQGHVDRQHAAWLEKLALANVNCAGELDQCCVAYWSGKECPEMRDRPWQYRTLKAAIVRRIGGWELP